MRERWRGKPARLHVWQARAQALRGEEWRSRGSVVRGPVPREFHRSDVCFPTVVRDRQIPNGSGSGDPALQSLARGRWRGTGPSPTVREAFLIVVRGLVPRERWIARTMARDRPSPYGEGGVFNRSAGACPPRALDCANDGEGHPLACACGRRGPKPYGEGGIFSARGKASRQISIRII